MTAKFGVTIGEKSTDEKTPVTIHCENVDIFYGDYPAITDLNLDIEESKITALIGPFWLWQKHFPKITQSNE